jgi:hypothetical protein
VQYRKVVSSLLGPYFNYVLADIKVFVAHPTPYSIHSIRDVRGQPFPHPGSAPAVLN